MSAHRVYLHVGAPKTGTTFLQEVLFHYRDRLCEHGFSYPADSYDEHFFAAVDLQDLAFVDQPRPEAHGAWERVAERVRGWPGTSVVSHDVFASATADEAGYAVDSLQPAEVHIVLTARDLARSLPSHWQEDVKHGESRTFEDWLERVAAHDESSWNLRWFWQVEDIPDVLSRWGAQLPPERVHVVTVPPLDAPRDLLWRRFATTIGLDPDDYDLSVVAHPNTGLGVAEVELLRRVNGLRDERMDQVEHEHVVKGVLAHDTLSRVPHSRRIGLPERDVIDVRKLSRTWVDQLATCHYDVVGDLEELLPDVHDAERHDPASATDVEVADAAVFGLHEVLLRLRDERRHAAGREADLHARWRAAESVIAEHRALPHLERIKRTVVEIGRTSRLVDACLNVYRRLRGRPVR